MKSYIIEYEVNDEIKFEKPQYVSDVVDSVRRLLGEGIKHIVIVVDTPEALR